MPKRSTSYRGMDICIISTAQQARPVCIHINDPVRAQLTSCETVETRKPLSANSSVTSVKKGSVAPTGLFVRGSIMPVGRGATIVAFCWFNPIPELPCAIRR